MAIVQVYGNARMDQMFNASGRTLTSSTFTAPDTYTLNFSSGPSVFGNFLNGYLDVLQTAEYANSPDSVVWATGLNFTFAQLGPISALYLTAANVFSGNDLVYGTDPFAEASSSIVNNTLFGFGGDDQLYGDENGAGRQGSDVLIGGSGADLVQGDGGSDTLVFFAGDVVAGERIYGDFATTTTPVGFNTLSIAGSNDFRLATDIRSIGAISFAPISGLFNASSSVATFRINQFSATGISGSATIVGSAGSDRLVIDLDIDGTNNGLAFGNSLVFSGWSNTSDRVVFLGTDRNDVIVGTSVVDVLRGDEGNDTLTGLGGGDTIDGGGGVDLVDYSSTSGAVIVELATGTGLVLLEGVTDVLRNVENVWGTASGDALVGNAADNLLAGMSGNDTLIGGRGADTLIGGFGSDQIVLRTGDVVAGEVLRGENQNDTFTSTVNELLIEGRVDATDAVISLFNRITFGSTGSWNEFRITADQFGSTGISGASTVTGGALADRLVIDLTPNGTPNPNAVLLSFSNWSAAGGDLVIINGSDGANSITGSTQNDVIRAMAGDDMINGFSGFDRVYGGDGNDTITGSVGGGLYFGESGDDYIFANASAERFFGGDGIDSVDYSQSAAGIRLSLGGGVGQAGDALGDRYSSIERVFGSAFVDTLIGGDAGEFLYGGDGGDVINSVGGDDILYGDAGSDRLSGGDGSDRLYGGSDGDTLTGGLGDDTFFYEAAGFGNDRITDFYAGSTGFTAGQDRISISTTLLADFSAALAAMSIDGNGNVRLTIGADSITFQGVTSIAAFTAADFLFV